MHSRIIVTLAVGIVIGLLIACGSDSTASSEEPGSSPDSSTIGHPPGIVRSDDTFSLESAVNAGWKNSKQLSAEPLEAANQVWYGFFDRKDIEIRFYASHLDALKYGVGPAEEAVGRVAQSAEAGGKLDQSRSRTGYDAFVIVGNLVMLCELEVASCEALIDRLE